MLALLASALALAAIPGSAQDDSTAEEYLGSWSFAENGSVFMKIEKGVAGYVVTIWGAAFDIVCPAFFDKGVLFFAYYPYDYEPSGIEYGYMDKMRIIPLVIDPSGRLIAYSLGRLRKIEGE